MEVFEKMLKKVEAKEAPKEKNPLAEAVRAEMLRALASDEFNTITLSKVERLAKAGISMLRASEDGPMTLDESRELSPLYGGLGSSGMILGGNSSETFGTNMLKELLASLPELFAMQNAKPERITEAIAIARAEGLTDIEEKLTKRLLGNDAPTEMVNLKVASRVMPDGSEESDYVRSAKELVEPPSGAV